MSDARVARVALPWLREAIAALLAKPHDAIGAAEVERLAGPVDPGVRHRHHDHRPRPRLVGRDPLHVGGAAVGAPQPVACLGPGAAVLGERARAQRLDRERRGVEPGVARSDRCVAGVER